MKAQSTIFPCPPEPESIVVSKTQAYWVRYIDSQDLAIVRLQKNPVESMDTEGGTLIEYDEIEVRIPEKELGDIPLNFDKIWMEHAQKGELSGNPIDAVDVMTERKATDLSQIKLTTRTRIALVAAEVEKAIADNKRE